MKKYQNDLFLRAARGEATERPPVWLMRQAGRILPQYRALRARLSGFIELVTTPELAAEVTIQPVDELGVDAAIIFSDILVIPEALGLKYTMVEKVGPRFPEVIRSLADVEKLRPAEAAPEHLGYVYDALDTTKKHLANRVPLIGFAGAPWTIFAYMVEGGGSKTFSKARAMLYRDPALSHALLEKIALATAAYLKGKIQHGADLIQIFDSWAGVLHPLHYQEFSLRYIKLIIDELGGAVPITIFAKDARHALPQIGALDCQVVQLDWIADLVLARTQVQGKVLQGNLDPVQLYAPTDDIVAATLRMIEQYGGKHIVNLGHGVYPDTPLEGVKAFVDTVKGYRY
ncbi:uroporphyrinogen decarboxylase [Neolewinella lacunae]|uniref:uroporphyrinogen decarboxylase n=1 Tax=Neolewinella lacunae TaxID=1517758 RepID=UPI0025B39613|nr:uroporphyrinogen decarboxylase [Neolewinella lacunae]MDN3634922.1 uroporphyrinogen decarboxylase [Neolewinella lacunae]